MCNTYIVGCCIRAIVSEVPLIYADSRCRNRTRVDVVLSVGISVTVSVPSNKVRVVVVFTKQRFC